MIVAVAVGGDENIEDDLCVIVAAAAVRDDV